MRLITFFTLVIIATANAQNDPTALAFHAARLLLLDSRPSNTVVSSGVVAGKCEYEGSNCNGAKVTLIAGDGTRYPERTLTGNGEFRYRGICSTKLLPNYRSPCFFYQGNKSI